MRRHYRGFLRQSFVTRQLRLIGHGRWFRAYIALVFLVSVSIPTLTLLQDTKAYAITSEVEKVIGKPNRNLSAKFSYDQENETWQFNKNGVASLAQNIAKAQGQDAEGVGGALSQLMAKQVGGGGKDDQSLYSVDLPADPKQGITFYDNVTRLSFTMVPDFPSRDGKLVDGRVVYPVMDGGQIVYTAMKNGLKEDIVLNKYIGDMVQFSYDLRLPETLEARLLDDGSVGVYSANLALFGNLDLNSASEEDRTKVLEARKSGNKDNLVFGIPAPFIKDQDGKSGRTKYNLNGTRLTVVASGLKDLRYPLTVDPSVTVTSSSDFSNGNNEGMISFNTPDQVTRGQVTGGPLTAGWVDTGSTTSPSWQPQRFRGSAIINGRIYALNNEAVAGQTAGLWYATLASNGGVGTWTRATAANPWPGGVTLVGYNGYLYIFGGTSGSGGSLALEQNERYAKPTGSGDVTAWTVLQATSPWGPRFNVGATAYNGNMYLHGGCDLVVAVGLTRACGATNWLSDTWRAAINADGTLGTWAQEVGATANGNMPNTRGQYNMVAFADRLYIAGGCIHTVGGLGNTNCDAYTNDVSYAPIASNGSVGAWISTTPLTTARGCIDPVIYNGYIYMIGGAIGQNCSRSGPASAEYAAIAPSGTVGQWVVTNNLATSRNLSANFAYDGYLYVFGGCINSGSPCGGSQGSTFSAKIDEAGTTSSYSTPADYDASVRLSFASVVHNNIIYVIGGTTGNGGSTANMLNTTRYATLGADGSVGAWSTASTGFANVNSNTGGQNCGPGSCPGRVNLAAGVYNGYMYIAGGVSNGGTADHWSDVQSAVICTGANTPVAGCVGAGDLRNWTTVYTDYITNSTTTYTEANGRSKVGMQIYNGRMYLVGGQNNTTFYSHIYVSTLTSNGGAGAFSLSAASLPQGRAHVNTFVSGGNLYIVGGGDGHGSWGYTNQDYSDVQFIPINNDGTLNTGVGWKDANAIINGGSGTSFAGFNARLGYGVAVSNGQLYITGGTAGVSNGNGITTVSRAVINANGSLGAWSNTVSFADTRIGLKSVTNRGYLYIVGGCGQLNIVFGNYCSSLATQGRKTITHAEIRTGGNGQTGAWNATGGTDGSSALGGYVGYGNYVYAMRGCGGGIGTGDMNCDNLSANSQGLRYAAVNADGSFGGWQNLSSAGTPPTRRYGTSAVAYNGYLYVIGGCTNYASGTCSTMSNEVYYAQINLSTGNVGTWATTTTFDSSGRYGLSAVAYGGYLYVTGGCTASSAGKCTAFENTVRMAQINSDGSTGVWSSAGSSFTSARFWHNAVAYGGRLYILAGCSAAVTVDCSDARSDVQVIGFNGNGTLNGTWRHERSFDIARSGAGAVAYNGYMYITGGCAVYNASPGNCTSYLGDVQFAPIQSSGGLGQWQKTITEQVDPLVGHGVVVANHRIITMFGVKSSHTYISLVRSALPEIMIKKGRYSKLIEISNAVEIAAVYFNGSYGTGTSLTYKVAPASGVFSTTGTALAGSGSEPTPKCGPGTIQYVQLNLLLDGTYYATFGDAASQSNTTDITIYYRVNATPPPDLRLNGGKWFYSEIAQPLDICKAP